MSQRFAYDSIGRLSEEQELRGDNGNQVYKNTYDFDRFGNLYRKQANNASALPFTPIEDSHISKATNRFTTQTTYDEAGQVITDNKFRGMEFGYDANGRMVKATEVNQPDALSVYDAAGMRVAECVNNVWKFSIYDIGGKMIAEYGGQQSTDEGGVKYVLQDWQGSTRALVSNSGYTQSRTDYTAFGEEINAGVGQRTTNQGFGANNSLNQKYALTERDQATGLDHTWFRKNETQAGRWTSPDPYNGSLNVNDPQSSNRYSYVGGQPVNFIDPSGLLQAVYYNCRDVFKADGGQYLYTVCQVHNTTDPNAGIDNMSGGTFEGGSSGPHKQYKDEFSCNRSARDIFHRMRTHFPDFANYVGAFGLFGTPTTIAGVAFSKTLITKGATVNISNGNIVMVPPLQNLQINYSVSVTVSSVSTTAGPSMGFSFVTNPGHVLHPATISFTATDTGPGRVSFTINVSGEFAGLGQALGYYAGGNNLEDNIWNNVIDNVRKYCGNR